MIINVANPIYDSVFKYLMEDERIARTIHTALIKRGNRLEKVLSVFDQSNVNSADNHVVELDEGNYAGDSDMEYILHRLLSAASNPMMRQDMNVEDEYFSAIENRDTALMQDKKKFAEMGETIDKQEKTIDEQGKMLRSMIKAMTDNGMSIDSIAKATGKTVEEIENLTKGTN